MADTKIYLHPDLYGFDLRRPFAEWPESVRTLIAERERAAAAGQWPIEWVDPVELCERYPKPKR